MITGGSLARMSNQPPTEVGEGTSPEIAHMVATRGKPLAKTSRLHVWADHYSVDGRLYPIRGAKAYVTKNGTVTERVTATRVVAIGVFALAAKKKTGKQSFRLVISGPEFNGQPSPGTLMAFRAAQERKMRKMAKAINDLAAKAG